MVRLDYKSVTYKKKSLRAEGVAIQNTFKFITLYLLIAAFSLLATKAFALQQLRNPTFNGNTNWNTYGRTSNQYTAATVNYQQNNLSITATRAGNARNYDNLVYQAFTTPANPINVRFDWGAWSATSADYYDFYTGTINNQNYRLIYDTANNNTNGTVLSSLTTDGNVAAGSYLVTNLAQNRNYYAKIYCYARLSYKSFTVSFSSFEVNFSPSGLAANLSTSNKNVNGTAFTFINGVNLTWNTSTSNAATLSKYNVYRSTTSGSGYEKVGEVAAGTTSYLDKPENPGTYYYVITDVDTNGVESPYSKEISITSPGQITGLTGEVITPWSPTSTFIRLGSNPSPGGAEIYFLRGTSSGNYNHYASWGGNTSVDDTNDLTDDTVYYYSAAYVFSYSPVRYSPLCEEISVYY